MDETERAIIIAKKEIESETMKTLNRAAIMVNQTLVLATPVDTGRARGNWFVGLDTPVKNVKEDSKDKTGSSIISENKAIIESNKKAFRDIYISNNLDYIGVLNEGHSAQAPAGFVEQAVQVVKESVK